MIIRIVKMTFVPEKVNEFLELFNQSKQKIRAMKGCSHLELLRGVNDSNIFFTYSYWEGEKDLSNYRNSKLFKEVWGNTKVLFQSKPEAWTVLQQEVL